MTEWRFRPLAEICSVVDYGVTASADHRQTRGPRFLRITDIVPRRIDWSSVPTCDLPEGQAAKFALSAGDIVVARTGATVGYAKYIDRLPFPAVFASYLVRFRVADEADASYVGHVIQSSGFKEFVVAHAGGAAQPNANAKMLGAFRVPLPGLQLQRRIATVLSSFDKLIEINDERIERLERLVRSLYREWFVQLRFPGHDQATWVDTALGRIPRGWRLSRLGEIAEINRRSLTEGELPDPLRYLDISSVGAGRLGAPTSMRAAEAPGRARRAVIDGDVVWSTVRPNRRAHGLVHDPPSDLVASTGLAVLSPTRVPSSFLFAHMSDLAFADYLVGRATGAAYPAVRPSDFEQAPLAVPTEALLEAFAQQTEYALRMCTTLARQSIELAATRDFILPRLVTGRLDISDIDLGDLLPADAA